MNGSSSTFYFDPIDLPPEGVHDFKLDNTSNHQGLMKTTNSSFNHSQGKMDDSGLFSSANGQSSKMGLDSSLIDGKEERIAQSNGSAESDLQVPSNNVDFEMFTSLLQESVKLTYHTEMGVPVQSSANIKLEINNFLNAILYDMRIFAHFFNKLDKIQRQKLISYFKMLSNPNPSADLSEFMDQATRFKTPGWIQLNPSECEEDTSAPTQGSSKMTKYEPTTTIKSSSRAINSKSEQKSNTLAVGKIGNALSFQGAGSGKTKRKRKDDPTPSKATKKIAMSLHSQDDDEDLNGIDISPVPVFQSEEGIESGAPIIDSHNWKPLFPIEKPAQRPKISKNYAVQAEILKKHLSANEAPPPPQTPINSCSWFLQRFMQGFIRTVFQNSSICINFIRVLIRFISMQRNKANSLTWKRLASNNTDIVKKALKRIPGFDEITDDVDVLKRFKKEISLALTVGNRTGSGNRWSGCHYREFGYLIRRLIIQASDSLREERPLIFDKNYKDWVIKNLKIQPEMFDTWFEEKMPPLLIPTEFEHTESEHVLPDVNWNDTTQYYINNFDRITDLEYVHSKMKSNIHSYYKWCDIGAVAYYDYMEESDQNMSNEENYELHNDVKVDTILNDSNVDQALGELILNFHGQEAIEAQENQQFTINEINLNSIHFQHIANVDQITGELQSNENIFEERFNEFPTMNFSQEVRQLAQPEFDGEMALDFNSDEQFGIYSNEIFSWELDLIGMPYPDSRDRFE